MTSCQAACEDLFYFLMSSVLSHKSSSLVHKTSENTAFCLKKLNLQHCCRKTKISTYALSTKLVRTGRKLCQPGMKAQWQGNGGFWFSPQGTQMGLTHRWDTDGTRWPTSLSIGVFTLLVWSHDWQHAMMLWWKCYDENFSKIFFQYHQKKLNFWIPPHSALRFTTKECFHIVGEVLKL